MLAWVSIALTVEAAYRVGRKFIAEMLPLFLTQKKRFPVLKNSERDYVGIFVKTKDPLVKKITAAFSKLGSPVWRVSEPSELPGNRAVVYPPGA